MFRCTITPRHRMPGCQSGVSGLRFLQGSAERGAIVLDLDDAFPGKRLALGVIRTGPPASPPRPAPEPSAGPRLPGGSAFSRGISSGQAFSVVDVRAGPADQPIGVFQGIAQAVVETLAVELGLADIVAPAQVGAPDSRVQGCQGPETCPGLGRPLRFLGRSPSERDGRRVPIRAPIFAGAGSQDTVPHASQQVHSVRVASLPVKKPAAFGHHIPGAMETTACHRRHTAG